VARPREFDTDQALRSALVVFWQKGFDGASLTDLADAMGIVRPSLHAAFGSKEDLYAKALDLYGREAMGFVVDALRGKTAADVCRLYLSGFCDMLTNPASPVGCFTLKAMMSCGRGAEIARQEGLTRTKSYETLLEQRFRRAHTEGDLPRDVDARGLAESLSTIAHGLAIRADLGATRAEMDRISKASVKTLF